MAAQLAGPRSSMPLCEPNAGHPSAGPPNNSLEFGHDGRSVAAIRPEARLAICQWLSAMECSVAMPWSPVLSL